MSIETAALKSGDESKVSIETAALKSGDESKEGIKRAVERYLTHQQRELQISPKDTFGAKRKLEEKFIPTPPHFQKGTTYRPICQLYNTYILIEDEEEFIIVDQHAAHERILYERLLKEASTPPVPSQILLLPVTLEFDYNETSIVFQHLNILREVGFDLDEFGTNSFILRAVPQILERANPENIIFELLADLSNSGQMMGTPKLMKESLIASLACHSAIKAGDRLNHLEELHALTRELYQTEQPYTCPHGRPTMIKFSLNELEKRFGRR